MILDLRIPLGLMFSLIGLILTLFGWKTRGSAIYASSLGIDANLWWGLVLLAFGLTMFLLGRRGQKKLESLPLEPANDRPAQRGH